MGPMIPPPRYERGGRSAASARTPRCATPRRCARRGSPCRAATPRSSPRSQPMNATWCVTTSTPSGRRSRTWSGSTPAVSWPALLPHRRPRAATEERLPGRWSKIKVGRLPSSTRAALFVRCMTESISTGTRNHVQSVTSLDPGKLLSIHLIGWARVHDAVVLGA